MELITVGYVGYESPTFKSMAEYGPEVFGFGLNETMDDESVYLTSDDAFWRIAVHPGEESRLAYVGWEAKDKYAFEDAVEKLRSHGLEVTLGNEDVEARRGAFGVAQFKDPAGWPHEIYYARQIRPGTFRPGRSHAGFLSWEYGMHVVIAAQDLDPVDHFCHSILELNYFGTGNNVKGFASFWRAKRSVLSHNIAYVKLPHYQVGNHSTRVTGHHTAFYCKSDDDVGIAYDLVRQREQHILIDLGKHAPDPVLSFYSMTPGGFVLECIGPPLEMPQETFVQRATPGSLWGQAYNRLP